MVSDYDPADIKALKGLVPKQRIIRNSIRCRKCNDVIESKHVHDFVPCSCGAVFVDGGHDYQRLGGFPDEWENLSIYGDST